MLLHLKFTLIFRLILPTSQDHNRFSFITKRLGWVTKYVFVGLLALHLALPSSYFGASNIAEASVFSAVASIFSDPVEASGQLSDTNSQKMPLLEAPVTAGINTATTSLIDDSALIATAPVSKELSVTSTTASESEHARPESTQISTYKVKSGDTVSGIAKKFGISTNTIVWANGLKKENSLVTGQTLAILPISGVKYSVVKGDTISSIAEKYKGDAQEIIAYNDLAGDTVKVGEIIVIPDGEMTQTQAQAAQSKALGASNNELKAKVSTTIARKVASVALGVGIAQADNTDSPTANSTSYYIRPINSGKRTQGLHGDNGVDLADACGTPIYAAAAGTVVIAKNNGGYNGGYGNYIAIDHSNGSQTLYAHMQHTSVSEGSHVEQGQQIGVIGSTGKVSGSTGCHVHFEIRNGPVNPF